jgi:hypothetical protein
MRKTRINRRTIRKQTKRNRKQNRKQRGGKTVLPMRFFTENFNNHYYENPKIQAGQLATSHGVPINQGQMSGPDLHIASPAKQQGGGALPAEYFGGNSGRYFEEGSSELLNCETAYGRVVPRSHGVVMDSPNGNWMGPNLASYPNASATQTGGGGCCSCGSKKRKKGSKKYRGSNKNKKQKGGYGKNKKKSTKKNKGKKGRRS